MFTLCENIIILCEELKVVQNDNCVEDMLPDRLQFNDIRQQI